MISKGACTNLLKGKFSRTFGEKVGGAAARMRCRTRSVRYLTTAFVLITLAVASYTSSVAIQRQLLLKGEAYRVRQ